jgi:hypothetical protein
MSNETEQDTITIPTRDLIWNILGDDQQGLSCAQITPTTAMILHEKLEGSFQWCVEYFDVEGTRLPIPILWRYADWQTSRSKFLRQKDYSERQRIERWLLAANVETLSRAIMRKVRVPEEYAKSMAYDMIKNPNGMIVISGFFGVEKLKTDVKELK